MLEKDEMKVIEKGWIEEEIFKTNISDSEEIKFATYKRTATVDDKESTFNAPYDIPKAFQPSVINWFYMNYALHSYFYASVSTAFCASSRL
jgi:hypothetical protein